MATEEYTTIFEWHPELILTNEYPVTWQGFLKVPHQSDIGLQKRIRLKLLVPNYPSLDGAVLNFGKSFTFLRSKEFSKNITKLIQSATTVSSFLRLLQTYINSFIIASSEVSSMTIDTSTITLLQDLKSTFDLESEIQLSTRDCLNIIRLSSKNVNLVLQATDCNINPWKVISCDLPDVPALGLFEQNLPSLNITKDKFKQQIEIFQSSWSCLKEIDKYCWVIDPVPPKPYHLYRRVYLTQALSVLITIDPLHPTTLPELKFLGSDNEVKKRRDIVSNNIHMWNPDNNMLSNLLVLLDIYEFPQKEKKETSNEENNGIVADEECCICFSLELENEHLPNKICDNQKCRRHFHTFCLLQWLQTVAGNEVAFNHIHGVCPNCGEKISCIIK